MEGATDPDGTCDAEGRKLGLVDGKSVFGKELGSEEGSLVEGTFEGLAVTTGVCVGTLVGIPVVGKKLGPLVGAPDKDVGDDVVGVKDGAAMEGAAVMVSDELGTSEISSQNGNLF